MNACGHGVGARYRYLTNVSTNHSTNSLIPNQVVQRYIQSLTDPQTSSLPITSEDVYQLIPSLKFSNIFREQSSKPEFIITTNSIQHILEELRCVIPCDNINDGCFARAIISLTILRLILNLQTSDVKLQFIGYLQTDHNDQHFIRPKNYNSFVLWKCHAALMLKASDHQWYALDFATKGSIIPSQNEWFENLESSLHPTQELPILPYYSTNTLQRLLNSLQKKQPSFETV